MTVMPQQTQMLESVVSAVFIQEPHLHHGRGPISDPHGSAHISLARTRIMVLSNGMVARRMCSHSYYILERQLENGHCRTLSIVCAIGLSQKRAGSASSGIVSRVLAITSWHSEHICRLVLSERAGDFSSLLNDT